VIDEIPLQAVDRHFIREDGQSIYLITINVGCCSCNGSLSTLRADDARVSGNSNKKITNTAQHVK